MYFDSFRGEKGREKKNHCRGREETYYAIKGERE